MLMTMAGWGCLLPDPWACSQASLPCPSLHTSMSLSLPHLYFEIMARTLLPSPFALNQEHTQHWPLWAQTTSTASANINNSDNYWYLFKALDTFPNFFPKILTTSKHSWHSAVWKATLCRLKQNTVMHLSFEEKYFTLPIRHVSST